MAVQASKINQNFHDLRAKVQEFGCRAHLVHLRLYEPVANSKCSL